MKIILFMILLLVFGMSFMFLGESIEKSEWHVCNIICFIITMSFYGLFTTSSALLSDDLDKIRDRLTAIEKSSPKSKRAENKNYENKLRVKTRFFICLE